MYGCHKQLQLNAGGDEPRVAVELHEVVDVPLGGREDVGGGVGQPVLGHLARRGVHVDRLGAAGRQVAVDDGHGCGVARLLAPRQMAVLLARRPEGDVLGAELVVEEFLKCNALINDNSYN